LCAALDRAQFLGLRDHADRLADSAVRLATSHAGLAERVARWRYGQGRFEICLAILDVCRFRPASLRLLRSACLLRLGRWLDAHLDLRRWSNHSSAPLDARVLLAMLEWEQGDLAAASRLLQRNLRHLEHPATLQALVLLALERGRRDDAATWAQRLAHASTSRLTRSLLRSLGFADRPADEAPAARRVEALAAELVLFESLIPTLVEADARRRRPATALLLEQAIERAMPELADRAAAAESIARLALRRADLRAARMWTQRGLAMNSLSAPLTLLLHEIESRADRREAPAAATSSPRRRSRAA
jgi:Tfp pilus assembly protein PilF